MFCFWDFSRNQGEKADFLPAGARGVGERRSAVHAARKVEPPCRAGAQTLRGVREDLHICRELSGSHAAPAAVPQHVSQSALLWVRAA